MTGDVIPAKPGVYKGISFRSQLEIRWAKWFDSKEWHWTYVDLPHYDFEVYQYGLIEIKPRCTDLVVNAIQRTFGELWTPGATASVCAGNPPSRYGMPVYFFCVVMVGGQLCVCSCDIHITGCFTNEYWEIIQGVDSLWQHVERELFPSKSSRV